jgi:hypothetical protein
VRPASRGLTSAHDASVRRDAAYAHARTVRASVHDRVALDEIELYAELIIAARSSEEPLSAEAIDTILGVRPRTTTTVRA